MDIMSNMPNINTNIAQGNIESLNKDNNLNERLKEDERLKEVCQDFESIFVHMMLKSGRSTVPDDGIVEKSNGTKMFEDMYDQEMANVISQSGDGGIGIGKMLYEQMKMGLNNTRPNIEHVEAEDLNLG